jgi:hypothetical protein
MAINIEDLPPRYQQQVLEQLARMERRTSKAKMPPAAKATKDKPQSRGEEQFYLAEVLPLVQNGKIVKVQMHKTFLLLEKSEFCGIKLPAAKYTPDFVLTYADGSVEAVEIKCTFTRHSQRDYIYRRRLFIEKYCRPNGWRFREIITDKNKEAKHG